MDKLKEKEAQAIKVLRTFEPEEGYVLAYDIPNMSKRISAQSEECLNAAWRKAGSFRLRGVTANPKP